MVLYCRFCFPAFFFLSKVQCWHQKTKQQQHSQWPLTLASVWSRHEDQWKKLKTNEKHVPPGLCNRRNFFSASRLWGRHEGRSVWGCLPVCCASLIKWPKGNGQGSLSNFSNLRKNVSQPWIFIFWQFCEDVFSRNFHLLWSEVCCS